MTVSAFRRSPEDLSLLPKPYRLLVVLIGNTLIGTLLWANGGEGRTFLGMWVTAQCVGLSICTVYTATEYFTRQRFGHAPSVVLGVLSGFPLGTWLAQLLGFDALAQQLLSDWQAVFRYASLGLIFTLAFSYFFHNRVRISELERERQEAALREANGQKAALLAELRLLQAQIEPHFLFNTLANLHSLIGRDDAMARQLLERLNDYLRASLAHSRARQATLGDECDMLEAYLAIQQQRMNGRLQVEFDVAADLRSESFPPMLLQPLVENAILHGIEPKLGNGTVRIRATAEQGLLRLVVEDDGVGFGSSAKAGHSLGLSNVRERLTALFGGAARLEIKDNTPAGVRVELWLPREISAH